MRLRCADEFLNQRVVDQARFADGDGEGHVAAGAEFFRAFEGEGIEELDVIDFGGWLGLDYLFSASFLVRDSFLRAIGKVPQIALRKECGFPLPASVAGELAFHLHVIKNHALELE